MGFSNISTDDKGIKVFAKEKEWSGGKFTTYTVSFGTKKPDGTWVNGYIDCAFKKGVEVANKSVIKINKAFFVAQPSGGRTYTKLMITDFEVLEEGEKPTESGQIEATGSEEFMNIPDDSDDLPFK